MNKKVLARLIIEYRKLSIFLCLILFLGLSQGLSKLAFNPDLETFFPEGHPATELKHDIDAVSYTHLTLPTRLMV